MPTLLEEPSPSPQSQQNTQQAFANTTQKLPSGVVLGKDGKPCRTCTSSAAWLSMMKSSTNTKGTAQPSPTRIASSAGATATATAGLLSSLPSTSSNTTTQSTPSPTPTPTDTESDCPPDVAQLGRATWTLLHTLTATYPDTPTPTDKRNITQFLNLFSVLYPCWVCAEDFRAWMRTPGNEPRVSDSEEFGRWMCEAHNAVNVKLGKGVFDCGLWRERWRDGWRDGRCG